jgi:hypothetical protein
MGGRRADDRLPATSETSNCYPRWTLPPARSGSTTNETPSQLAAVASRDAASRMRGSHARRRSGEPLATDAGAGSLTFYNPAVEFDVGIVLHHFRFLLGAPPGDR